ncbi:molybdopterin molybdotransferase MoeA [Dyella sp.]|uniref:molybdopterin molybdotransferase MoeA n=1 Tax=Dyella sp. TaxID=1869338 RepID=UPI002ED044F9
MERLLAHARRMPAQTCQLHDAKGRVLAEAVRSPIALPSFDHSAMDGYALDAAKGLAEGSEHRVAGSQAAGDSQVASYGRAWEIMTGARLPQGLDAVIAVERTQILDRSATGAPGRIRLLDALSPGRNVRYAGSDIALGAAVLPAGTSLSASHMMLLAALGMAQLRVARAPCVAIICTGKELQADLAAPLRADRIFNSNGPYLSVALAACGARVLWCETVDDTSLTYEAAVRRAIEQGADLVVSTGAVSMGRYDFVPDALLRLGADLLFHKVAIRPGKPQLAAVLPGGPVIMALPGTPMAVAVGMRFFIAPLLRAMLGQACEPSHHAVLEAPCSSQVGLHHFLHGTVSEDARGQRSVHASTQQQPFRIHPFAQAQAWVILPAHVDQIDAGQVVQVASLHASVGDAWGDA